jgi:hypothetical protein
MILKQGPGGGGGGGMRGVNSKYRTLYLICNSRQVSSLKAKYHPIELDHNLGVEEKIPHMVEWYTQVGITIISS